MAYYDPLIEKYQQNKYEEQYNRNHSSNIGRLQPGAQHSAPQAYVDEPGGYKNDYQFSDEGVPYNNNPFLKLKPSDPAKDTPGVTELGFGFDKPNQNIPASAPPEHSIEKSGIRPVNTNNFNDMGCGLNSLSNDNVYPSAPPMDAAENNNDPAQRYTTDDKIDSLKNFLPVLNGGRPFKFSKKNAFNQLQKNFKEMAIYNGSEREKKLKIIFEKLAGPKFTRKNSQKHPLHVACEKGHAPVAAGIMTFDAWAQNNLVNMRDCHGQTPLFKAAANGHNEITGLLLNENNIVINTPDSKGKTPLQAAVANGHLDAAVMLINEGAKDDKAIYDLFFQAVQNGRNDIVRQSLNVEGIGIDVNKIGSKGKTPLQTAVANGHLDVAATLINEGAKDAEAMYDLFFQAVRNGRNDIVQLLKKADVKFDELKLAKQYFDRGKAMEKSGNHKSAIDDYEMAIKLNLNNADVYYNLGRVRGKLDEFEGARDAFKKATELNPKHADAYYRLGNAMKKLREFEGARDAFEKATELNLKHADAYFNLGDVKVKLGELEGAKAAFKKATELNPKHADAYFNLGLVKYYTNDYKGAKDAYEKAIDLNPKDADAYYRLGNARSKLGDKAGARDAFKKATELNPKHVGAHSGLGNTKYELGDIKGAKAAYKKASKLNPNDAFAHIDLGRVRERLGDHKGAIKAYEKAIDLNPKLAESINPKLASAYYNLGVVSSKLGDHKGAIKAYEKAIDLNPNNIDAHIELGVVMHYNTKDFEGAIKAYEKAIDLNPKLAELINPRLASAYYGLGLVWDKLGVLKDAKAAFKKAIELNPKHAGAYIGLGNAKYALGKFHGAKKAYETAIQLKPDNAYAHIGLGNAKSKLRDFAGARAAYEMAEKLKSNM
ncbi:MAG: tetratricopeptide repeat protein [Desulfobacteraceae bacterium]|nr:tetratricopeptide repeat protein [Desulfobacteraceae bacterium]